MISINHAALVCHLCFRPLQSREAGESKPVLLPQLNSLRQRAHTRINPIPFLFESLRLFVQRRQRNRETLYKFVLFQLRDRVLVLGKTHVDSYMDEA